MTLIESTNLLPELPDFLRRSDLAKPNRTRRQKKVRMKVPHLPYKNKPPKGRKFKDAYRTHVILEGQAPRIGSGYRNLWAKVGRKWVYLCDSMGQWDKVALADFKRAESVAERVGI